MGKYFLSRLLGRVPLAYLPCLTFRDLQHAFRVDCAVACSAFVIEEAENLPERVRAGGIPEKRTCPANANETDLAELFKMVRKGRSGDAEFLLNFTGDQTSRMRGEQQANNLQTGLGAEGTETFGRTSDQEGIGSAHISIVAEL
jgi:hypothetical protein